MATIAQPSYRNEDAYVLWAQLLPVRCDFQKNSSFDYGLITYCEGRSDREYDENLCSVWDGAAPPYPENATDRYFANELGLRKEGIRSIVDSTGISGEEYSVEVIFNENTTVSLV